MPIDRLICIFHNMTLSLKRYALVCLWTCVKILWNLKDQCDFLFNFCHFSSFLSNNLSASLTKPALAFSVMDNNDNESVIDWLDGDEFVHLITKYTGSSIYLHISIETFNTIPHTLNLDFACRRSLLSK